MKIISNLLCSFFWLTLLMTLSFALPVDVSGLSISPIDCGEQLDVSIAYDGASSSTFDYDLPPAHTANERVNQTRTENAFGNFLEFLAAERGSQALVQMAPELYANGEGRVVAGYYLYGNSGLFGSTYNVNVFGMSALESQAQGLGALSDALKAEAQAAGASQISITGNAIVNEQLANPAIAARAAGMNGFTYQQVNSSRFLLTAPIKAP